MKRFLLVAVLLVALVGVVSADTLIVYTTNATDGELIRGSANVSWENIRDGAGTGNYISTSYGRSGLQTGVSENTFGAMYRTAFIFDTSGLPDTGVISGVTFSVKISTTSLVEVGYSGIGITGFVVDDTLDTSDYDNFGNSRYSLDKNISEFTSNIYYNYTLNSVGIANISKTGVTGIFTRIAWDIDNVFSGGWVAYKRTFPYFSTAESVTYPPYLTIEYTVPDTTPPSSITSLTNTSVSCSQLFFNWTNPTDADYGGLMIWRNNVALTNLSSTDTGVSWTGLPESTDITFSSKTFDTTGNINATFVNMTKHTDACAVAPVEFPDWDWCADQDIFFRNDSSDIAGYSVIDHIPQIASTQYKTVSVSSDTGTKELGRWVTPSGSPGVTLIGPGLWRFRVYLNVSSASGTTNYEFKIFNRSSDGTETDLFYGKVIGTDINDLTPTEHLISYARRNYTTMFNGDRLVIKVNASTSSVAARNAWISLAGNTEASMVGVSYFLCDSELYGGSGNSGVMVANELPLPAYIPISAAGLTLLLWRRKLRM
jgi:hypothetical protein